MAGLIDYDHEGILTIGGIIMNRPAFAIMADESGEGGLLDLITTADQRGEDRLIPGAGGVIPNRRRLTVTAHDLRLLVVGDVDETGSAHANYTSGLAHNLDYIYNNVVAPVVSTTGTRSATLVIPGLGTKSASIHVTGMRRKEYHTSLTARGPAVWEGTLTISIPAGRFS